ncbi:flagellar basal body-associated FliL family protein [Desulfosporosinus sp. PR]|uniref:flagellar basal body-associated FliL family protein n=1 Tax=Candidatus Desulfosporosinus nitrosoreducens TaxID=3401928 RepID=UPI0027F6CB34|nr:flagellar basal body-associated FliL family protein [Desulfosporosinus sp. PR]MDQ7096231.1 flagellar basal body-associated FliL family protein [Desulfosporosinus sp. PR]
MNKKSLIFTILVLLVGTAIGVGGTVGVQKFFFKSTGSKVSAASAAQKDGPLLPLGEFTVNLQGGAFLKTSLTVEVTDAKAETQLKNEDAFLKDRVNTVLANKSLADVQTAAAREKLREELIKQLNEVANNQIDDVLFVSLVYQ